MFGQKNGFGFITCVVAAAALGAAGYAAVNSSSSMKKIRRKAAKAVGKISDRVIDSINSLM